MIKECVVLNGTVINIGPWDYKKINIQLPTEEGQEPKYEEIITNPLPEGAEIVELEIAEGPDGGLYPVEQPPPKSEIQKLKEEFRHDLDKAVIELSMSIAAQQGG
ncbi:hypothetical protein P9597_02320 [Aneurinibacillus migulanus]|uniref:hypothetical protein n=1 Tax=Aneurinibacillus migulanus TaxID=47500 RepID=UPI002E1C4B31|nr:hypothetical protein [Aneurinibacillus migulanus]